MRTVRAQQVTDPSNDKAAENLHQRRAGMLDNENSITLSRDNSPSCDAAPGRHRPSAAAWADSVENSWTSGNSRGRNHGSRPLEHVLHDSKNPPLHLPGQSVGLSVPQSVLPLRKEHSTRGKSAGQARFRQGLRPPDSSVDAYKAPPISPPAAPAVPGIGVRTRLSVCPCPRSAIRVHS